MREHIKKIYKLSDLVLRRLQNKIKVNNQDKF